MKALVTSRDPDATRAEYPLDGLVEGWFFRVNEVSPCHYLAEGTDLWGRVVSASGDDADRALADCVRFAGKVVDRPDDGSGAP